MGNTTLERCIEKHGEELGRLHYHKLVNNRQRRAYRRSKPIDNTPNDVIAGRGIQCSICGKIFKRITPPHLKNNCVESTTIEEYRRRFPNNELMSDEQRVYTSNTKDSIVEKYGTGIGEARWEDYCKLQKETNTYEYKHANYGMTRDEFSEYNSSRASTLENFVLRHGEIEGNIKWNEYVSRQRYTTTEQYFIETYGEISGKEKYNKFCEARVQAEKNRSKIEEQVFAELSNHITGLEQSVRLQNLYYGPYDYGSHSCKKLIEFYGSYWRADPTLFNDDDIISQKGMTAKHIRSRDQAKRTYAITRGYEVFVIWEREWKAHKEDIILKIKEWWNT